MNTIKLATSNGIGIKVFLLLGGNENSGLEALNTNNEYTKGICSFDVITDDTGVINEYSEYSYHKYLDTTKHSDTDALPDIFEEYGMMCTNGGDIIFNKYYKVFIKNDGFYKTIMSEVIQ